MKQTIGFIGLGLMGNPMAKNILKQGFSLMVYNRTIAKTHELESLGAKVANSPSELSSQVDIVITMVTSGKDVEEILFGENGVTKGAKKDLIVIDMSTIGPTAAKEISKKLKEFHIEFLDAPVTGSTPKAITGELTIFIGGEKAIFEKAREVLSAMGTNLIFMGKTGNGQAIKLINNYLIASYFAALAEGMLLADGIGLSREMVEKALSKTINLSPAMQMKLPNYVNDNYPLTFSLANLRKDVGLALLEMQQVKEYLPGLIQTEKLYGKANIDSVLSKQDYTVIIKEIEKEMRS